MRRHLHRHRRVPDRRRRCRLPDLLRRLRQRARRPHGGARARQGDRREGQGLRLQREARHLDHRPARGRLQGRDEELLRTSRCSRRSSTTTTPTRRPRSSRRCSAACPISPACSAPTCSRPAAPPTASSRRARPARSRSPPSTRRNRSSRSSRTAPSSSTIAQHPAEIGYFGFMAAYAHLTGNSVPTAIGTGFTVMTKANIDDPERRAVPLQERVAHPPSSRAGRRAARRCAGGPVHAQDSMDHPVDDRRNDRRRSRPAGRS